VAKAEAPEVKDVEEQRKKYNREARSQEDLDSQR
jgi:hypothetical protein